MINRKTVSIYVASAISLKVSIIRYTTVARLYYGINEKNLSTYGEKISKTFYYAII